MKTVLIAGYPKSGNTLLGGALRVAGRCESDFDIYTLKSNKVRPTTNKLFSSDTFVIKTHDRWRPGDVLDERYFAPVEKVIVVIRNPFDTLLSTINFLRVQYREGNIKGYVGTFEMLFPGAQICDDFLDFYSLESLRSKGLLDPALGNFSLFGTTIPGFSRMSGPWAGFANSYKYSGLPVMNVRYEDLATLSEQSLSSLEDDGLATLNTLSKFLDISSSELLKGFKVHRGGALEQQKSGNLFFNKMRSGYWRDYLSAKACADFANQYAPEMIDNGYRELVEEFHVK
jgi:hypothetical protein